MFLNHVLKNFDMVYIWNPKNWIIKRSGSDEHPYFSATTYTTSEVSSVEEEKRREERELREDLMVWACRGRAVRG